MSGINLSKLSTDYPVEIFVQDDSYYPAYGGGSKARKIAPFLKEAKLDACDSIVTAGAANSNHAKVVALACAERGWKCTIVVHDKEDYSKGNLLLMKLAGAKLVFTALAEVGSVMDSEMESFRCSGNNPYYIYGGGHGLPGYIAFYNAAKDFVASNPGFHPDYVVHASGTGGTQAGLTVGFNEFSPKTKVVGVSVARNEQRGYNVVRQSCEKLSLHLGLESVSSEKISFKDDWVGKGYGATYPELMQTIKTFATNYGLITDPTYTGKALHGLKNMIDSGEIPAGSNVLFWHTGGLLNLLEHSKEMIK